MEFPKASILPLRINKYILAGIAAGTCMGSVGCVLFEDQQERYLKSAVNQATEEDVAARLGRPREVGTGAGGESVWRYVVYSFSPGDLNSAAQTWCDIYVLQFSPDRVLRSYDHQRC
ncbi:MAG TPA: hypothetical protein VFA38_07860 [Nitrospirales bacterium]|nr:hypothetical protein [Nitrospirales bacterium]